MNSCDWTDCSLEVGLFDGAPRTLLSAEGRKNIPVEKNRFINLCAHHFELGLASLDPQKEQMDQADGLAIDDSRCPRFHLPGIPKLAGLSFHT